MAGLFRRSQAGEYSAPKTVLAFYAGVLAILEAGIVGVIAVIATSDSLHYLVPWVLGFGGVILPLLVGIVFAINIRDPSKLQLGQMTGREFIDYQKLTLGDSTSGEYTEEIATPPAVAGDKQKLLEPIADEEAEKAGGAEQ